jgi:hypothetical protein
MGGRAWVGTYPCLILADHDRPSLPTHPLERDQSVGRNIGSPGDDDSKVGFLRPVSACDVGCSWCRLFHNDNLSISSIKYAQFFAKHAGDRVGVDGAVEGVGFLEEVFCVPGFCGDLIPLPLDLLLGEPAGSIGAAFIKAPDVHRPAPVLCSL